MLDKRTVSFVSLLLLVFSTAHAQNRTELKIRRGGGFGGLFIDPPPFLIGE